MFLETHKRMKAKNIKFSAEKSGARYGYVFILSYAFQKNVSTNLNVRSTPYMIFFTEKGEEISRIPGYVPADEFMVQLKDVLEKRKNDLNC